MSQEQHPYTYRWIAGSQLLNGQIVDTGTPLGSGNFSAALGEQIDKIKFTPSIIGLTPEEVYSAIQRGDAQAVPTEPIAEYRYITTQNITIETTKIPAGTEIGRGASPKALRDRTGKPRWVHFQAAEGYEKIVNAGRVVARLTAGTVTAERIKEAA